MDKNMLQTIRNELHSYADSRKVRDYMRFFKTAKGDYGEGDIFLGIKVPDNRKVVKKHYKDISMENVKTFLYSAYHEERLFALLILVAKYKKSSQAQKEEIFNFYIKHIKQINSWDLVDVTCYHIIGAHLLDKERTLLYTLANSDDLWQKRIAIVSTFAFINAGEFDDTFAIADILLHDEHDLIHKAVGWAIRNVGNKNLDKMLEFLNPRYKTMPRTMLRYAIEKLNENIRQAYLKGEVCV